MKAINIKWENNVGLPNEMDIPSYVYADSKSILERNELIGDYITDENNGACHFGFELEVDDNDKVIWEGDISRSIRRRCCLRAN